MTATVLVTRPPGSAGPLLRRLQAAGFATRVAPTVALEPVDPAHGLRPALAGLASGDWLVVTSRLGATVAAAEIHELEPRRRPRLAVIGPATGRILAEQGLPVAAVATEPRAAALVAAMAGLGPLEGLNVVLARSDVAGPDLPDLLMGAGARVRSVVAYRTVIGPAASRLPFQRALSAPVMRAVFFASGSAVRGAIELAGPAMPRLRDLSVVTIGPATTRAAREAGLVVTGEAAGPDAAAQVAALQEVLAT